MDTDVSGTPTYSYVHVKTSRYQVIKMSRHQNFEILRSIRWQNTHGHSSAPNTLETTNLHFPPTPECRVTIFTVVMRHTSGSDDARSEGRTSAHLSISSETSRAACALLPATAAHCLPSFPPSGVPVATVV